MDFVGGGTGEELPGGVAEAGLAALELDQVLGADDVETPGSTG